MGLKKGTGRHVIVKKWGVWGASPPRGQTFLLVTDHRECFKSQATYFKCDKITDHRKYLCHRSQSYFAFSQITEFLIITNHR